MSTDTKKVALAQHTVTQAAKACPEEDGDEVFRPLTAEEARQWRERQPQLPVTRALVWEGLTGLLVAVLAWLFTRRADVAWSAAYGSLAGALPAALAALGTARWAAQASGHRVKDLSYLPLTSSKTREWVALLDAEMNMVGFAPVDGF